jgi:hypothetical protein
MQVEFDLKYERSKKKISKRINIEKIEKTEQLFCEDPMHKKLELKNIVCRRDKHKKSIRVLGNEGFRILISIRDDIAYFQDIMDHNKYDRMTKDC